MEKKGIQFFKGDIVKTTCDGKLHEVAEDNTWNKDFNSWGSVWFVNEYPPHFTHKGGLELVMRIKK